MFLLSFPFSFFRKISISCDNVFLIYQTGSQDILWHINAAAIRPSQHKEHNGSHRIQLQHNCYRTKIHSLCSPNLNDFRLMRMWISEVLEKIPFRQVSKEVHMKRKNLHSEKKKTTFLWHP